MFERGFGPHVAHQRHEPIQRNDGARRRIGERMHQLDALRQRADRHIHRTQLQDAEEHRIELRTVRQEHRYPVARANAMLREQGSKAVREIVELGERRVMPVEVDGRLVWRGARPVA